MTGSPLASVAPLLHRGRPRPLTFIRMLVVHTTGSGIVEQARRHGADPLEWAVAYYGRPESYCPHYVCGWDGHLVQVVDEEEIALHVGLTPAQHLAYEDGTWRKKIDARHWDEAWPGLRSPLDLSHGSANAVSIGVEMLPVERPVNVDGEPVPLWFTDAQHEAIEDLAADVFGRHAITPARTALVGHEDVGPLDRWDAGGGWDPGARRARPRFDWGRVLGSLGIASG